MMLRAASPLLILLAACAGVAGCTQDEPPMPAEVGAGEAQALREAAAMLEARPAATGAPTTGEAP